MYNSYFLEVPWGAVVHRSNCILQFETLIMNFISVFLSFCLSVFLSFCLSVFLSFCLSVFLSFCLSVFLLGSFFYIALRKNIFVSIAAVNFCTCIFGWLFLTQQTKDSDRNRLSFKLLN
jgi:hypothetical protein